jgi:hypothetical protein
VRKIKEVASVAQDAPVPFVVRVFRHSVTSSPVIIIRSVFENCKGVSRFPEDSEISRYCSPTKYSNTRQTQIAQLEVVVAVDVVCVERDGIAVDKDG